MKKLFVCLACVAAIFSTVCADDLYTVPFNVEIPTTMYVDDVISNKISQVVSDDIAPMVRAYIDNYIETSGSSALITNLFENARGSFVQSIGGVAYGLKVVEAVVERTEYRKIVISIDYANACAASDNKFFAGKLEIEFDWDDLAYLMQITSVKNFNSSNRDVIKANIIASSRQVDGQVKSVVYSGVQGRIAGSSSYSLKYRQINGITLGSETTDGRYKGNDSYYVYFSTDITPVYGSPTFCVGFIYKPETAAAFERTFSDVKETGGAVAPENFIVTLFGNSISYSSGWNYINSSGGNDLHIYLNGSGGDEQVVSVLGRESYGTSTEYPSGVPSPVITEDHLNVATNAWVDMINEQFNATSLNIISNTVESNVTNITENYLGGWTDSLYEDVTNVVTDLTTEAADDILQRLTDGSLQYITLRSSYDDATYRIVVSNGMVVAVPVGIP